MSDNCTKAKKKPLQWKGVLSACAALGLFAIALYWAFSAFCDTEHKPGELIMQAGMSGSLSGSVYIEIRHAEKRGQADLIAYEIDSFSDSKIGEFLFESRDSGAYVDMLPLEERFGYSDEILRRKEVRLNNRELRNLLKLAKDFEASGYEYQESPLAWGMFRFALIYNDVIYKLGISDEGVEKFEDLIDEIISLSPIKPSWHFWPEDIEVTVDLPGQYNIGVFPESKHLGNWLELYPDNTFVIRDSLDRNSEIESSGTWSSKNIEREIPLEEDIGDRVYDITLSFTDSQTTDEVLNFGFLAGSSWSIPGFFITTASDITPEILEELEEALEALDADELYRVDIDD